MNILTGKSSTNIEEKIAKIKPKYYWIVSALLAGLAAYLAFGALGVLGTGDYIILAGDGIAQYGPVLQGLADSIRNGETIWYSFSPELGVGMAYQLMFTCWSPFNILYIILGFLDVETITRIVIILKIMAIAASFTVFAQKVTIIKGAESIFFSLCYSMGGYLFAIGIVNFSFLDSMIFMPLIFTVTVNAFETGRKYYWIVIFYALLFITCFHLGYSIGIFTLLFVIAYMIFKIEERTVKDKLKMFFKWSGCVCVAILISGVFLLPGILQFAASGYEDAGGYYNRGVTIFNIINTFFYGTYEDVNVENGMLYSGLPVFMLTPLFFVDKKIKLKDKLFWGFLVGALLVVMSITPLYYALCAFDVPNCFNYRFGFAASFVFCVIALIESEKLKEISSKKILITILALSIFYLLMMGLQEIQGKGRVNCVYELLINVAIMFVWFLMFKIIKKVKIDSIAKFVIAVFLIVVELAFSGQSMMKNILTHREWYENYAFNVKTNADTISSTDSSFYRVISVGDEVDNSPLLFNYNGINLFATCRNENLSTTMERLGFANSPRCMTSAGSTPVSRMLFGIKYMINPGEYKEKHKTPQITIPTVNDNALGVGYMVDEEIKELSFNDRNAFDNSNALLEAMTGLNEDVFVKTEYFEMIQNGVTLSNNDNDLVIGKSDPKGGTLELSIPKSEEYDDAYMQFVTAVGVNASEDTYYVYGGDNIFGLGNKLLSSPAIRMLYDERGDRYSVLVSTNADSYDEYHLRNIDFRYFSKENLERQYDNLKQEELIVSEWKDGYIKGHVDVSSGRKVLFLSIPHENGWIVKVNGVQVTPIAVVDDSFMAIELSGNGSYDIELKYKCPGVISGIAITLCGIIMLIIMIAADYRQNSISLKKQIISNSVE